MAVSQDFIDTLTDALRPLGHITVRKMFGGAALYCDGQVFALIADDVLHLKVDAETRPAFEAEECGPFTYATKDGVHELGGYHRAPDRLLDDDDDLRRWVHDAVAVGRRAAQSNPVARVKTTKVKARKR